MTAQKAGLKNLILTHFSPRFSLRSTDNQQLSMDSVQEEAEKFFKCGSLFLARDSDIYQLSREGEIQLEYRWNYRGKTSS